MVSEDRRPSQLEILRKEHYDKVYGRQKQLMKRLFPLLNKSDIIEANIEPTTYSLKDPLVKSKVKTRKKLRKAINIFESKKKLKKTKTTKKISQVRPDVLWGLSR